MYFIGWNHKNQMFVYYYESVGNEPYGNSRYRGKNEASYISLLDAIKDKLGAMVTSEAVLQALRLVVS